MTAEIVIMNKSSIAIATDSAVSIQSGENTKIFNSVNKLFSLSENAPVGIMLYNSSSLCGLEWELIIKEYKRHNSKTFEYIEEYAKDFFEWLEKKKFFPLDIQLSDIKRLAYDLVIMLINEHEDAKKKINGGLYDFERFLTEKKASMRNWGDNINSNKIVDSGVLKELLKTLEEVLKIIDKSEENFSFDGYAESILDILCLYLQKNVMLNYTGIVFVGFGDKEIFPKCLEYKIELIYNNRLKYILNSENKCSFNNSASIVPFAQSEIVDNFMTGIDAKLSNFIYSFIEELLLENKNFITDIIKLKEEEKKQLENLLDVFSSEKLKSYLEIFKEYKYNQFISPIVDSVSHLPKEELAIMAETLVNLTSFKRKMTLSEAETVGGPIDVAIISKGDGFIWIKRKHYFNPELNTDFFNRKVKK